MVLIVELGVDVLCEIVIDVGDLQDVLICGWVQFGQCYVVQVIEIVLQDQIDQLLVFEKMDCIGVQIGLLVDVLEIVGNGGGG